MLERPPVPRTANAKMLTYNSRRVTYHGSASKVLEEKGVKELI